jgi:anti-anti-sigma factor
MSQVIHHIRPSGRLDTEAGPRLEAELLALIQSGARRFLFDCSDLTYMGSAGLRVVVIVAKAVKAVHGRIVFCGVNPQIRSVFEVTGFTAFLDIVADRADGLRRL